MAAVIRGKLQARFRPEHLDVINESASHNVPAGSETHFRVVIVSSEFEGQPLLARHRAVQETLADELRAGVHALSITARTAAQWAASSDYQRSPACMGGDGTFAS